jgi:hypothetical protein
MVGRLSDGAKTQILTVHFDDGKVDNDVVIGF